MNIIKRLTSWGFGGRLYPMHFVMAWEIFGSENKETLQNQLKGCIQKYSWVQPLASVDFYIVPITTSNDWTTIFSAVNIVASTNSGRINLVMSPVIDNVGGYNGWLPVPIWNEINKRTQNR